MPTTAPTIALTPQSPGIFRVKTIPTGSAESVNELLQFNHDNWHILWDAVRAGGLHNHQVHYLLTDFALGASPAQIREAFRTNKDYQRPVDAGNNGRQLTIDDTNFSQCLGQHKLYSSWLSHFENEVAAKGWVQAVQECVFADTPRAKDLFGRMFEGALHPIIHLGFGLEFIQPAIVAEALAQAAIHVDQASTFLNRADHLAQQKSPWKDERLMDLFLKARSDPAIVEADCWKGGSFELNGNFFDIAPQQLLELAASYKLGPDCSEAAFNMRTVEMINVSAWFAAAAQRPDKEAKFDFFYMHCVNCSLFLSLFATAPWLSLQDKVRLLEWKVRMDLVIYVCQGSPLLVLHEIIDYKPRQPDCMNWGDIISRALDITCDGHVVKMIRALRHGAEVSRIFEEQDKDASRFPIRGDMWLKIANMVLDSTEDYPDVRDKWMRGPGFDRAWDMIPNRK
ncbi:hypothetical protein LTR84_010056 [Exophiala bonariae]|uniref:Oxidoreductase AflY n=1 Tax=Exophiala bonariae TaxID=1690606 RepID=A0AAV9NK29_9EURO|nr:hypothetical protein LTR84_010056 [Exophiala bonariae]